MTMKTHTIIDDGQVKWVAVTAELLAALQRNEWTDSDAEGQTGIIVEPRCDDHSDGGPYAHLCQSVSEVGSVGEYDAEECESLDTAEDRGGKDHWICSFRVTSPAVISPDINFDERVLYTTDEHDGNHVHSGAVLLVADRETLERLAGRYATEGMPGQWILADGCPEWMLTDLRPEDSDLDRYGQAEGGEADHRDFGIISSWGGFRLEVRTPLAIFKTVAEN